MKRSILTGLVLLGALIVMTGNLPLQARQEDPYGAASQPASPPAASNISGSVVSSGDGSLVIETDAGVRMTFALGETSLPQEVKSGDRVTVEYHVDTLTGSYQVTGVSVAGVAGDTNAVPASPAPPMGVEAESAPESHDDSSQAMPRTSSLLPLIAMIGLFGLGASLILRAMSRTTAQELNTFKR